MSLNRFSEMPITRIIVLGLVHDTDPAAAELLDDKLGRLVALKFLPEGFARMFHS
jgi:hypothetical protein